MALKLGAGRRPTTEVSTADVSNTTDLSSRGAGGACPCIFAVLLVRRCPAQQALTSPSLFPPGRAFELNAARSRQPRPAVPGDALRGLLARETAATGHLPAGHTRARADQATFALRGAHLALRGADAQFKRCRPLVRPSCARALPVGARSGRSCLARSLHAPVTCTGEAP